MNRPPIATDIGESRAYRARIASVKREITCLRSGAQQLLNGVSDLTRGENLLGLIFQLYGRNRFTVGAKACEQSAANRTRIHVSAGRVRFLNEWRAPEKNKSWLKRFCEF